MSSPTSQKNDEETSGVLAHAPEDHAVVDDNHDWQYDAVSNSSLTGAFTTITNVFDGHADGAGEQYYSPSRSTFEVVDIIDDYSMPRTTSAPMSNDGSNIGSYDSYYHMQKNGPPILAETDIRHHSIMRYGWRGGGMSGVTGSSLADTVEKYEIGQEHFREDASESNTNDRASSLSSLTNDFFPKIDRQGGSLLFTPKRNRKQQSENQGSNSPTSSNDKSSSQTSKIFPKAFTPQRVKKNNLAHGSPWYVNKHHSNSPSPQNSSDQTPMTAHPLHPPGEVLVAPSHKASDSNPTPSVISSSNMSQYFSNELREMYNSNVYRSYQHRYNQALSSPKAKRIMISSVVLAAMFAIIAIIAISLGARSQNRSVNESGVSSYYDIQQIDGLPQKCCVGKFGAGELTEADMQERIEPTAGDSKAPSPSTSPMQNTLNNLDWEYITLLTPNPTHGEDSVTGGATPNPTPGEDSIGWRPSIIPSWIPPTEKETPVVATQQPSRRPTRKPTRQPSRSPTRKPSEKPTKSPTKQPTPEPTLLSTDAQTKTPTRSPTNQPTSKSPTLMPTILNLSGLPSASPSASPNTEKPTDAPFTDKPTAIPSVSVSIHYCRAIPISFTIQLQMLTKLIIF